jgi:Lrp/AsnC family transcriptional regulator
MDDLDKRLLRELQRDDSRTVDALAEAVGLSRNACWRRMKKLEEDGVIARRVAILDPARVNLGLQVFIAVKVERHEAVWLDQFARAMREIPEVLGVYRIAGEMDYLVRARVPDVTGYDALYKKMIKRVALSDVAANFVMEEIKDLTELPLDQA